MLYSVALALALLLMAATAALFAWTLRAKTRRARLCFFLPLGGGILALPILYNLTHEPPLGRRAGLSAPYGLAASRPPCHSCLAALRAAGPLLFVSPLG